MKSIKNVLFFTMVVSLFVLSITTVSQATTYTYATDIRWDNGLNATPSSVIGSRYNQTSALGNPDSLFLSLGVRGIAVFDFGVEFNTSAIIFETTYGDRTRNFETAKVYAINSSYNFAGLNSVNGAASISTAGFTLLGSINNLSEVTLVGMPTTDLFRYLLLQDTSGGGDGFDVNAVGVTAVPEPSSLLLLGSGIVGLVLCARKRKRM